MKRTKLPADRVVGTSTDKQRPLRLHAVALAAAVLLSLPSAPAHALALGRVTVQSALGEPLRAEIDLPEITPDEIATLRASVASPEAFRAAGMEFSPALGGARVTLERRSDGRHFLRIVSDRPVTDPFVDLILETQWRSGRIVRDFTMLFDPPSMRQGQAPLTAQVGPQASQPGAATTSPVAPRGRSTPSPAAPAPRAAAPAPAPAPSASAPAPAAPAATGEGGQVTVKAGDTAGRIASANKPATVSLDQMLVAMLRANPDAFIGGNINRLRSGAVLNLPSAEQAESVPPSEASQTLVAQSRDFNEFRRRVAEAVPTTPDSGAQRESRGQVQAQVEEKRPAAAAPDKLTLSKGAVQGRAGTEERIARERASQDASTRVAELNRNLGDLNRLSGATPGASAPRAGASAPAATAAGRPASTPATPGLAIPGSTATAPATPASAAAAPASARPAGTASAPAPAAAVPASAPAVAAAAVPASAPAPAAQAPASAPAATASAPAAAASAPAGSASAPDAAASAAPAGGASAPAVESTASPASAPASAAAPVRRPAAPPPPPPEPSLLEEVTGNPAVLGGLGAIILLVAGAIGWRIRQRRKATQVDSSFLESRLQPDSFFGASGGQRVDTADAAPTGSSMVYSPSQLDAAGDVDPVAEADVYLAYGRDLQAEEILKEALRINPQRVAIHTKLLEIYAKRRDAKAFEQVASEAYGLTQGEGPEWSRICELGQEVDPVNPMYQPGGQPGAGGGSGLGTAGAAAAGAAAAASFLSTSKQPAIEEPLPAPAAGGSDVDLDLDFSLGDDDGAPAPSAAPASAMLDPDATLMPGTLPEASAPSLSMDFNKTPVVPSEPAPARLDAPGLTLDENSLNFSTEPMELPSAPAPAPAAAAPAPAAADPGMIEFDLGALSLDLEKPASAPAASPVAPAAPVVDDAPSTAGLSLDSAAGDDDPLATKLALAQEFNAIGDADGARSLAQEVIAEASGDLKSRAQKFLAEIG